MGALSERELEVSLVTSASVVFDHRVSAGTVLKSAPSQETKGQNL